MLAAAAASADPSGATLVSIAVLPFADMSQAKDQEYLTDGISEELLNVLARVEGFKVTGRTSAFAFKGRDEDLRTIGQKLGVENILEGSVRKQGDRIRVTAQLVKAADGYHLWSETYDRQLGDVFAIQDDIARQVVDAVRTNVRQRTVQRRPRVAVRASAPYRSTSRPTPISSAASICCAAARARRHAGGTARVRKGRCARPRFRAGARWHRATASCCSPVTACATCPPSRHGRRPSSSAPCRSSRDCPKAYAGQALLLSIKSSERRRADPAARARRGRQPERFTNAGLAGAGLWRRRPAGGRIARSTNVPTRSIHWRRSFSSITHSSARYADIGARPSGS